MPWEALPDQALSHPLNQSGLSTGSSQWRSSLQYADGSPPTKLYPRPGTVTLGLGFVILHLVMCVVVTV